MTSFYIIPFLQGIPNCIHPIHASLYPSFVLLGKKKKIFSTQKNLQKGKKETLSKACLGEE